MGNLLLAYFNVYSIIRQGIIMARLPEREPRRSDPAAVFDATIAKRHQELLRLSNGLRVGLELISDLGRVNELLAASPRPSLVMTERVDMMSVNSIKDIGREVNNFVPSMAAFGMPILEERRSIWSDEMELKFVGRRDYTDEEKAKVFLMGARGDHNEHFAFAETNA